MTSVRVDTTPLIAGACVVSAYAGHGIRGADVPSTGLNGPGPIYGCLNLPADADVEFRLLVETVPAGLTSFVYGEADDLVATGPDGTHVGAGRLFADGVDRGAVPITLTFGGGAALSGGAPLDDGAAGGGVIGLAPGGGQVTGGATLDGIGAGGDIEGGGPAEDFQALAMYTLLAPIDQIENLGGFAAKAPEGRVLLAFEFKRFTASPSNPAVTIERLRGAADDDAAAVLSGLAVVLGSRVYQWVQGGVDECDYKVHAVVTAPDGSVYPMTGILPVRAA